MNGIFVPRSTEEMIDFNHDRNIAVSHRIIVLVNRYMAVVTATN